MAEPNADRRRFLLTSSAAAVTVCAGRGLTACNGGTPPGVIDSGLTVADVAVGTVVAPTNAGLNALVGRDATGFYAYTDICPHQGCQIPVPDATSHESTCPCHSSKYTSTGDLAPDNAGPSTRALDHYAVSFSAVAGVQHIFVDTSVALADRTVRTAAP